MIKLGFDVSERSVSRYLYRTESRDRGQGWRTFLKNHQRAIFSIDFFYSYTLSFKRVVGLVVIDHHRRLILHTAVTAYPTVEWTVQQLLHAFPGECPYRYLICDNDQTFGDRFETEVQDLLGVKVVKTNKGNPWMNAITERTIGSIRRELLDHVIVLHEQHLASLLTEYASYFNSRRTHMGIQKNCPISRAVHSRPTPTARLQPRPILGGLHHNYQWSSA